jgi:ribonuclease BN (tRNA processing enzyme)
MNIRFLGVHNCESLYTRPVTLLIDNALVLDAGGLTSCLSLAAQQGLKVVFLTHHHYDHIRDVPLLAMSLFLSGNTVDIYSTRTVYDALAAHLLNGRLYPDFLATPEESPAVNFTVIKPYQEKRIGSYTILAVPVNHGVPAVGYLVTGEHGKALFYTGDTGPGLAVCWEKVSPQLLIIEVTTSDRYRDWAKEAGHLTPGLLKEELTGFRKLKGYLPRVITVHMNPLLEGEIAAELETVARDMDTSISLAGEGMEVCL